MNEAKERELSDLRHKLFEAGLTTADYKAMLRDMEPSEVFSDENGFKILVGNYDHASDFLMLETKRIHYVLNMAASDPTCRMTQEVYGEEEKIKCKRIFAGDMPGYNISQHFPEVNDFLDQAKREGVSVLVHCVAGASRSPTVVMAYLMERYHYSLEEAAAMVRGARKRVFPNLGFVDQLVQLDRTLQNGKMKEK